MIKILILVILAVIPTYAQTVLNRKDIVNLKIIAPFKTLFVDLISAEIEKRFVNGTVEYFNPQTGIVEKYLVKITIRGTSTVEMCDFKKLQVEIDKPFQVGGAFKFKKFDINTHCYEAGVTKLGKSNGVKMDQLMVPHREQILYRLASELGFVGPLTVRARIDYIDNSNPQDIKRYEQKDALLLESNKELRKRLGADYEVIGLQQKKKNEGKSFDSESTVVESATQIKYQRLFKGLTQNSEVNEENIITAFKISLFEMLIGNEDWQIDVTESNSKFALHNITCLSLKDGRWLFYPEDFNLADVLVPLNGDVAGYFDGSEAKLRNENFFAELNRPKEKTQAIEFYVQNKKFLFDFANTIQQDEEFKKSYLYFLNSFYNELEKFQ